MTKHMLKKVALNFIARNRCDLWHVAAPVLISTLMATSSLAGASLFLVIWIAARGGVFRV